MHTDNKIKANINFSLFDMGVAHIRNAVHNRCLCNKKYISEDSFIFVLVSSHTWAVCSLLLIICEKNISQTVVIDCV